MNEKALVAKKTNVILKGCGVDPQKRSIPELLNMGVVIIDKPPGPTSHQVAAWAKEVLNGIGTVDKAGHGGTLDPSVTGVLPVALGRAVRGIDSILLGGKEYIAILRLHSEVPEDRIRAVFKEFTGDIYQTPPVRSSVKREMRVRRIYALDILEIDGRDVLFRAETQAGTYIRTLCVDIGAALGVGGNMQELRRIRTGPYSENMAVTLQHLRDVVEDYKETGDEAGIRKVILPAETLFSHMKSVVVKDTAVDSISHGADLSVPGIHRISRRIRKGERVAIYTAKGEIIAIGTAEMDAKQILARSSGLAVKTERVFMEPGTYLSVW